MANSKNFFLLGNDIINPYFLLVIFCGIYLTIRLKFPQFRFFFLAFKIFSGILDNKGSKGQLVHSQAFFAGTASSLLLGAIIGSAVALTIGGIGALFWIWIGSILIMPIRFVSSTMAIKFRTKLPSGRYLSGPMYFIEKALKAKWLAVLFSLGSILAVLFMGGVVPTLTMTHISNNAFGTKGMFIPILVSAILIYVSLGGIRRVGKMAGFLTPIGLVLFFFSYFILFKSDFIPFSSFLSIVFHEAFQSSSIILGGGFITIKMISESFGAYCMITEVGVGKSAGISGVVRTDSPVKQGLVSMLSSFFEGMIVSTLVFYLLVSSNALSFDSQMNLLSSILVRSDELAGFLFNSSLLIFGLVAICGWFYTGEQSSTYISGEKFANFFRIFFVGLILFVSYTFLQKGNEIFYYSFNFGLLMVISSAIPVLVSLLLLTKSASYELSKFISESGTRYEIFKDFYILLLSMLPKNFLSKFFGALTYIRLPRFMMIPILKAFAKIYKINVSEAELNLGEYNSLNQFFTRALKAGARIVDSAENAVVSPVDARITSYGDIQESTLIQAKGLEYSLKELLGSDKYLDSFSNGKFITFYLSPQDYHRIHSPFYGKILGYYYEPGKLFPVNDLAVLGIRGLFPKNERLITFLQTEYGKIAVVKVGASNVGKIRVTYDNKIVTNSWLRFSKEVEYKNVDILIQKGAELGRFEMGSTVILIFEKNTFKMADLKRNEKQTYGSTIGYFKEKKMSLPK
ncbi:MAG: archaetidylserine decarboxylase [Leptospiraceae bacterium]|nr:phosphatidylserine decarboxylase [Leptospiraceae bacterium]MCK6380375.1 archaetidylserine decarboxylase [Leptospiraceae bacterium]NUM41314.1 phosphatidylserine decarboxylase [Leptospiraceae bacterium]